MAERPRKSKSYKRAGERNLNKKVLQDGPEHLRKARLLLELLKNKLTL